MTFGEKLYDLRRRSAMSQDTLAEKLEVTRQSVSKWERDEAFPETDKIIRIAQIFGVTTDYLLLEAEASRYQPPPPNASNYLSRAERMIRRHGYKGGYLLIAAGILVCLTSIALRLLWPAIAGGFTDSFWNTAGSMQPTTGIGSIPDGIMVPGMLEIPGSPFDDFQQSAQQSMDQMVRAQANLFLIGLLPGTVLIAAGLFIVIKGKKIAGETPG